MYFNVVDFMEVMRVQGGQLYKTTPSYPFVSRSEKRGTKLTNAPLLKFDFLKIEFKKKKFLEPYSGVLRIL